MSLHFRVIAALSDWDSNHLWTDARFIEKPTKPPLVLESRLAVCSIVWSQATAEKLWSFYRCTEKLEDNSGRIPVNIKYLIGQMNSVQIFAWNIIMFIEYLTVQYLYTCWTNLDGLFPLKSFLTNKRSHIWSSSPYQKQRTRESSIWMPINGDPSQQFWWL